MGGIRRSGTSRPVGPGVRCEPPGFPGRVVASTDRDRGPSRPGAPCSVPAASKLGAQLAIHTMWTVLWTTPGMKGRYPGERRDRSLATLH